MAHWLLTTDLLDRLLDLLNFWPFSTELFCASLRLLLGPDFRNLVLFYSPLFLHVTAKFLYAMY